MSPRLCSWVVFVFVAVASVLLSASRQEHSADGGELTIVPRESLVKTEVGQPRWAQRIPYHA